MSKPSWMMMEREEFFQKLDMLIAENKNTFMIAVFIPHESLKTKNNITIPFLK